MMIVTVEALVVRDARTNKILDVHPVRDSDDEVTVTYYQDMIESIDKLKEAVNHLSELYKRDIYFRYIEGEDFQISMQAGYMPSIGYIKVRMESKEVEWT